MTRTEKKIRDAYRLGSPTVIELAEKKEAHLRATRLARGFKDARRPARSHGA